MPLAHARCAPLLALAALLKSEAAVVRRLDMPIGSSLLLLAQKRPSSRA